MSLAPGDGAQDDEGLAAGEDRLGEGRFRWVMRKIFFASEVAHKGASFERFVIADGATEHRIARL